MQVLNYSAGRAEYISDIEALPLSSVLIGLCVVLCNCRCVFPFPVFNCFYSFLLEMHVLEKKNCLKSTGPRIHFKRYLECPRQEGIYLLILGPFLNLEIDSFLTESWKNSPAWQAFMHTLKMCKNILGSKGDQTTAAFPFFCPNSSFLLFIFLADLSLHSVRLI